MKLGETIEDDEASQWINEQGEMKRRKVQNNEKLIGELN
jgi:hypothetical protein